jgi:hypothetical protein
LSLLVKCRPGVEANPENCGLGKLVKLIRELELSLNDPRATTAPLAT